MDIYILRDGKKTGPFSDEAVRVLLQQGDVAETDMACRKGASEWELLAKVLEAPAASPAEESPEPAESPLRHSSFVIRHSDETSPEPPPAPVGEPATAAQIAFLTYFGVAMPAGLLKEDADQLVAAATNDPHNAKRLATWKVDSLHLYPDLFAAEALAKMENRAQFFFDLCETAGADYFTGVTKAHCKVLVDFLDVKFPRWDAKGADATERYFFPAIAEQFPQLVNKAFRGRFRYGVGMLTADMRVARKSPTSKLTRPSDSPLKAIGRGFALGLCILAVLYVAYAGLHGWKWGVDSTSNTQPFRQAQGPEPVEGHPTSNAQ